MQKLREGVIGDVYMARGLCFKWRDTIGRAKPEPVPAGVHYDLWLGPAPKREFTKNRFHYNWHWFWDYGNGDIGNQGIHQMDIARWGLGVKYPAKVSAMGGHFMFDDDQETPNTHGRHLRVRRGRQEEAAGVRGAPLDDQPRGGHRRGQEQRHQHHRQHLLRLEGLHGRRRLRRRYKTFLGKEQEPGPATSAKAAATAATSSTPCAAASASDLNADIEEGAISTVLVHLANISYRLGRTLQLRRRRP